MKNLFLYLFILISWFIGGFLFRDTTNFYNQLNLPFFALPGFLYGIVWTILFIMISYSIYLVFKENKNNIPGSYLIVLILNYIINQTYTLFLFNFKNLFLSFINTILILITTLILYDQTKKINEKASKFLIPYLLFSIFAVILSLTIYFMNIN